MWSLVFPLEPVPKVTVPIPVYNTPPGWLRECLNSVLTQDGVEFDVVVVDDGSTDQGTLETLAQYNGRIHLIRFEENRGVGAAMEAALEEATGEYTAFIGSDDIMLPGRLRRQVELLERGDYHLVSGQVKFASADGTIRGESSHKARIALPWTRRVLDPTVTLLREDALAVGGFNPRKKVAEATDLWYRWRNHYGEDRVLVSREFWTIYRLHPGSLSYKRRGHRHLSRWRTG